MTNTYFPQRASNVLSQYVPQLLYPDVFGVAPPSFNQAGGNVPRGFNLTMSAPRGTIYYTTNGADPRVYGSGAVSPGRAGLQWHRAHAEQHDAGPGAGKQRGLGVR